jgi:hypothetical protein
LQKGFTDAQAKIKAVWENPHIANICTEMPNITILMSNVAAAMNPSRLSSDDKKILQRYAHETRSDYCAGCTDLCEAATNGIAPIGDVMRYLMYCRSYGDHHRASQLFNRIPQWIRAEMAILDYTLAEQRCPQKMAIGRLMREAVRNSSEERGQRA